MGVASWEKTVRKLILKEAKVLHGPHNHWRRQGRRSIQMKPLASANMFLTIL
jgi:hypothetical protein